MDARDQINDAGGGTGRRAEASSARPIVLAAMGVLIATWLGSQLGELVRFPDTGAAILFPPYAVLATALLLTPPRDWWVYLLASFAGHMLALAPGSEAPATFVASTEIANATRALVAAVLWRSLRHGPPRFDTIDGTALFVADAGVLAPAVAALVGAGVAVLYGQAGVTADDYWRVWVAWFLSNAIIGVTLLPMLLHAAIKVKMRRRDVEAGRVAEASLLAAGLFVSSAALLGGSDSVVGLPVRLYAPLPFLLWAAVRFGTGVTGASLLVVSGFAIVGVMNGWGPFASRPGDSVLTLYLFLAFTSVPCLLLAALVQEREQALAALSADITERKRAQEALQQGERRMALAATSARLGFWAWNVETETIWLSDHGKRVWGLYSQAEPTLERLASLVHEDDRERAREACAAAVDDGTRCEGEFRIVREDGETRWVSVKGRLELDGSAPTQIVGVVIDVTERKQAELELHEQRQELAHLSRVATLGQLSGALAHELRQPLTAILFNSKAAQRLLTREPPDLAEVRAILSDIEHDDARAGEVIRRLSKLLKKGETAFEPLELSVVVQDGLDVAHGDIMVRGVVLSRELERTLPPVLGDRVALQQVVVNLVLNACEAMATKPAGERRLTVGTTCDESGSVVAYVVDRGTGISEPDLERVFEPFVTSRPDGLGLGLAICRTIVRSHEGRLWAVNNPGGGATFFLTLPPVRGGHPTPGHVIYGRTTKLSATA